MSNETTIQLAVTEANIEAIRSLKTGLNSSIGGHLTWKKDRPPRQLPPVTLQLADGSVLRVQITPPAAPAKD